MKISNLFVLVMLFTTLSCRGTAPTTPTTTTTKDLKTTPPQEQSENKKAEAPADVQQPPAAEVKATAETHVVADKHAHTEHAAPASTTHADHASHKIQGTDPETAFRWLKNGNRRFVKGFFRKDGATSKDVKRLSSGQKPHSIVLSCSDSRVPPEVIFDQKLGEIFTVRTAGEVIEPATIGTIEYAVEHLGARNLLVLGHTNCGAVKAAFSTLGGKDAGSENLNHLVKDIHPRINHLKDHSPSANYVEEGWANVNGVVKDLMARSKILEEKIKSGEVKINSGVYDLETGLVEFK